MQDSSGGVKFLHSQKCKNYCFIRRHCIVSKKTSKPEFVTETDLLTKIINYDHYGLPWLRW